MKLTLTSRDGKLTLDVVEEDGGFRVSDGKRSWRVALDAKAGAIGTVVVGSASLRTGMARRGESWEIVLGGVTHEFLVRDARFEKLLELQKDRGVASGRVEIRAPIPGLVTAVLRQAGEVVKEGEPILVLAAMKLENEIRAPRAGKLAEIRVAPNAAVEKGEVLAVIE